MPGAFLTLRANQAADLQVPVLHTDLQWTNFASRKEWRSFGLGCDSRQTSLFLGSSNYHEAVEISRVLKVLGFMAHPPLNKDKAAGHL